MADLYMHLLNGRPAEVGYYGAVVYAGKRVSKLATSLQQIRREQRVSVKHYGDRNSVDYGYVRIARSAHSAEAPPPSVYGGPYCPDTNAACVRMCQSICNRRATSAGAQAEHKQ